MKLLLLYDKNNVEYGVKYSKQLCNLIDNEIEGNVMCMQEIETDNGIILSSDVVYYEVLNLRNELDRYKNAYDLWLEYFDDIPEELRNELSNKLNRRIINRKR
jgi:hypothetical protein